VLIFVAFLTENVLDDDGDWSAKDWLIFLLIVRRAFSGYSCIREIKFNS
jgi:hypothetical protein